MFDRALYLRAAEDLRENPAQWQAYQAERNCVVLAGPGSGKTKTLATKLAKILDRDVHEPRGLACITYNNECAREIEERLHRLGIEQSKRVFIGTVHSFSLTQLLLPYGRAAALDLPDPFRVATQAQQRAALERAYDSVINRGEDPHVMWRLRIDRHRRSILDRDAPEWLETDAGAACLVEAYEGELRRVGLIDFEDMPLLALRILREHEWARKALLAKYPFLIVDEYQDLGPPLHEMVLRLCFETGMRLFAVGDPDQSIYGFTGARPELLLRLAEREDVDTVRLRLNYRSGTRIVAASQHALGEVRDYEARPGAAEGTIFFHPLRGNYDAQAEHVFTTVLAQARERLPGLTPDEVAILYPAAWIGDSIEAAAARQCVEVTRSDGNALYPRGSRLLRWH